MDSLAGDAEVAGATNNMRQLYRKVGRFTILQNSSNQTILDLNGSPLTCNDDQVLGWKEHLEAISNSAYINESQQKNNNFQAQPSRNQGCN